MSSSKRLLLTGILVGTLDIIAAFTQHYLNTGKGPDGVVKFIASGLFGTTAFAGGASMVIAGLIIHYLIAISFTLIFFLLIKNIELLRVNRLVTGLLYGAFIWFIMNRIVLPITKAPPLPRTLSGDLQALAILVACVGLPLAFLLIYKKQNAWVN
jgi:hypothetical protein